MMKVWMIKEECHGFIGLATTFNKAIEFLIENDWINAGTEDNRGCSMEHYFGAQWKETALNVLTAGDLADFGFYLRMVDIYD